ncbi:hypothetical protein [Serratia phage vB_SmaM_Hera]|uniref:Uncharacterized protein n=1 Tax=Serratia phage vB_SmaM_Hera TaxID=2777369 RepID=A0A7T3TKL1_9CAUD|nr:hypothetical protein [Serratia phage vB_SmaM_Hera]
MGWLDTKEGLDLTEYLRGRRIVVNHSMGFLALYDAAKRATSSDDFRKIGQAVAVSNCPFKDKCGFKIKPDMIGPDVYIKETKRLFMRHCLDQFYVEIKYYAKG